MFQVDVPEIQTQLTEILEACKLILKSNSLYTFLRAVLQIGNFLNQGTAKGNAQGFKMAIILQLEGFKGFDSKKTPLLKYMVENYDSSIFQFSDDLLICQQASQLDIKDLELKVKEFTIGMDKLQTNLKKVDENEKTMQKFLKDMNSFFVKSQHMLTALNSRMTETQKAMQSVFDQFALEKSDKLGDFIKNLLALSKQIKNAQQKLSIEKANAFKQSQASQKTQQKQSKPLKTEEDKKTNKIIINKKEKNKESTEENTNVHKDNKKSNAGKIVRINRPEIEEINEIEIAKGRETSSFKRKKTKKKFSDDEEIEEESSPQKIHLIQQKDCTALKSASQSKDFAQIKQVNQRKQSAQQLKEFGQQYGMPSTLLSTTLTYGSVITQVNPKSSKSNKKSGNNASHQTNVSKGKESASKENQNNTANQKRKIPIKLKQQTEGTY